MSVDESSIAGHRVLPHTADVMIEAWGLTRVSCMEEAVRGLVEAFADVSDVSATEPLPVSIDPGQDDEMFVALLEEAVYIVDVFGSVPVGVTVEETEMGGLAGFFDVAPAARVRVVGAVPKAVSRSGLAVACDADGWKCRATIDV
ncbi:MAG: archease [Actinomycetota bacterium]